MKPTVTTEGKAAHLRYELPHRVHTCKVYPLQAPNGSTIVLYGHETGVGVLWRGGRPLEKSAPPPKQAPKPPPKVNGTSSSAVVIIDSDDEDTPTKAVPQSQTKAEFDDDAEELDPDQPYPSVVQQLRLALNTAVLHIAVPDMPAISAIRPAESVPTIFSTKIVFSVACADCSVRIITLPLSPPTDATKELPPSTKARWGEEVVKIPTHAGHQSIPRGVSMTWTSRAQPHLAEETDDETMEVDGEDDTTGTPGRRSPRKQQSRSRSGGRAGSEGWAVLLASHSTEVGGLLKIWRFELTDTSVSASTPITAYRTLTLSAPATRVAFNTAQNPKRRHSQLLIADVSGVTRVYDPFAPSNRKRRVGSATDSGGYVALFRATFDRSQTNTSPTLASRKRVLDAAWVDDGRSILALLADGEWGIWDVERTGPNPPSDPSAFSVRGFLGTSDESRSNNASTSPKKQNKLVPMTPNTRRTREEHLFRGTSSSPSAPTRGAISVASLPSTTGDSPEESALIWFGSEIHRISNVAQFWTRVASTGSGVSLSRPPISKIQGLRLLGESITSIDQFETTTKEARMAVPRDALVSTEHRLMIITSATEPLGRDFNAAFAREQAETEETRRTDQALLASGELDLGGMDRLLENMEGSGSGQHSLVLGNPRRVLFASSTS